MFKKILIGLAVIILIFVIVVALQPASFRITRSTTMAAAPAAVFAQVNDFHAWEAWSPWAKMDPACKYAYIGPASGQGAHFSWAGNDKVGEGAMTIMESKPAELVKIKLEFIKPFAAVSTSEFTFKSDEKQTNVTWSMYGENNFFAKAFSLFMDCDKMVGGDFEKGLASMKAIVEAPAKK